MVEAKADMSQQTTNSRAEHVVFHTSNNDELLQSQYGVHSKRKYDYRDTSLKDETTPASTVAEYTNTGVQTG